MTILFILLSVVITLVEPVPVTDNPIISIPDGQVQGILYTTENNKTFYGFQGIPYATPPIGSLRFEGPKPPQPWTGIWDATKDSKVCLSDAHDLQKDIESEDCLYVNVYTPSLKPAEKLPVMVWIHGGKFVLGSSQKAAFGPDFLVEEDVIVVSFNYRLGAFGFLSTGDSAIVGNAGLKDQALAIKWAHDNIAYFGGDPDKITIFGESAGGASAGLQLVSKKTAGLYRAAIVQSGSAVTNWTIDPNPKAYADLLTSALGGEMYLNDTKQLTKFLKEKSAEDIINAANLLISIYEDNQAWPVIEVENDDAFLTESPYELLDSGRFNQVPIIIGICANEALTNFRNFEVTKKIALQYDTTPNTIIPRTLRENSSDEDVIIKAIQNLYLEVGETFSSNMVALANYHSDNKFTRGIIKHAELSSKYVPVYFYQFAYYGRSRYTFFIPDAEKAGHGAEIPFLFKMARSNTTDPVDILTQRRIVKLWTNFAKLLHPVPERSDLVNIVWPTMTANDLQFLNINATLEVRSPIKGASYEGWNNIFQSYGKKPFITY